MKGQSGDAMEGFALFRTSRRDGKPALRHQFLWSLVLLLAAGPWLPGSWSAAHAATERPPEDISEVFAAIERAWSEGDANALVARFGSQKVLLRLPDNADVSRRFSHQQSLLILKHHFVTNEIRRFHFVLTRTPEAAPGRAMGFADVTWRQRGVGRTNDGRILMVLERENARWVLTEIQSLP